MLATPLDPGPFLRFLLFGSEDAVGAGDSSLDPSLAVDADNGNGVR